MYDAMVSTTQDTKLLEQFICPHTGQILKATKTGRERGPSLVLFCFHISVVKTSQNVTIKFTQLCVVSTEPTMRYMV